MKIEPASINQSKEDSVIATVMKTLGSSVKQSDLFIGLDRDGTLVPYADRPEDARVDLELQNILTALSDKPGVRVGIISARSIAQLCGDFDAKKLFLAGNYGMEISPPAGEVFVQPFALDAVPALKKVRDRLAALVNPQIGAILEDHGYSLCLHWHLVPADRLQQVINAVAEVKKAFGQLLFSSLPSSFEVKPPIEWNKGDALKEIFQKYHPMLKNSYVMYAGDSLADEPAFAWANSCGGISLRVGGADFETCSNFQLSDVQTLRLLLSQIAKLAN